LSAFEHHWKHPVQAVLFLFGFANAGVPVHEIGIGTWPVATGLIVGKPIGIGLAVLLALITGLRLPQGVNWRDMAVVGCAAGIGFTVALFFATASFPPGARLDQAKLGALLSVGSAVVAFAAAALLKVGRFSASRAEGL